jgi:hypothetical protein
MKNTMRLALLALLLTVPSLSAGANAGSGPPLCDSYCVTGGAEDPCTCPDWTDQRVEVSTCQDWDGYWGCWWF